MLSRTVRALSIASLFLASASLALAADPFVGKWKFNQSKSKMSGEREIIQALGGKTYKITSGEISYTIVTDGTDQPSYFGRTRAIAEEGPNTWRVVDKRDGRTLGSGTWTLSPDSKTMSLEIAATLADGSPFQLQQTRKRVAGTTGFAGVWEDTTRKMSSFELEIQPYESDGFSIVVPAEKDILSMKFDGKDYPESGPHVAPGAASSGRRVDERTFEVADKVEGKVIDTTQYRVSPDGNTLTLTVHDKGQAKPVTFVYDRQ